MSIRSLALELYKAKQKLDALQKNHDEAPSADKSILAHELTVAQKEFQMLRRMLDGEKESGEFRKRFSGFGNSKQ